MGFQTGRDSTLAASREPDELIARAAELFLIDQEATQPIRVQAVGGLGHERDAGKVGESIAIAEGDGAALLDAEIEDFKLAAADPREHVAHAVVVAELGVFVGNAGIAGLLGPEARLFDPGVRCGRRAFRRRSW